MKIPKTVIVDLEKLRNAYWRMDDAIDECVATGRISPDGDEVYFLSKAHKLLGDIMSDVDPVWSMPNKPEPGLNDDQVLISNR